MKYAESESEAKAGSTLGPVDAGDVAGVTLARVAGENRSVLRLLPFGSTGSCYFMSCTELLKINGLLPCYTLLHKSTFPF